MLRLLREFRNDQSGTALLLVGIMLPAIIGFSLLVIDWSRASNLHNDLQKAADSFALAAAAELDARPDSWDRAERALAALVDNTSQFSDAGFTTLAVSGTMTIDPAATSCRTRGHISWCFLEDLPALDSTPIGSVNYAATPEESQFIEVDVTPTGFSAIFPASFLSGNTADNTMNVGATAVAGNAGSVVCDMTPLFMCNPFPSNNLNDVVANEALYRKGIHLVTGTTWGPGNFGFLRPESAHGYGEGDLAQDLADGVFSQCVNMRLVYTQTGSLTEKAAAGLNTRFDMYGPHFPVKNANKLPPPPAPNVRKGYQVLPTSNGKPGDVCGAVPATDATRFKGYSRDLEHPSGGLIGNGKWEYEDYITVNNLTGLLGTDFRRPDGSEYTDENPPSRYDLYMEEYRLSLMSTASVGGETGTPACFASAGGTAGDPERRLIYAALLDCSDPAVVAELNGQSGAPPAIGFASFFLTEPADDDVYAEIVDIDGARGRGTMVDFVKENVQLYR